MKRFLKNLSLLSIALAFIGFAGPIVEFGQTARWILSNPGNLYIRLAYAQSCNDPSGFIKSRGTFTIGDTVLFGPDCQTIQSGGATPLSITTPTIATLRALDPPSFDLSVYVVGYATAGDGGEGWFNFSTVSASADNSCTVIRPGSAPATGRWSRAHVGSTGNMINVRWCGAKGDAVTDDNTPFATAVSIAVATRGGVYVPAVPSNACYLARLIVPDNTSGLKIMGDAQGFPILFGPGSTICQLTGASAPFEAVASLGGSINQIYMENIKLVQNGTGPAAKFYGVLWSEARNNLAWSAADAAWDIKASFMMLMNDQGYTSSGDALRISSDPVLTNSGPATVQGGQYAAQNATGMAVRISGDPLGVGLVNVLFQNSQSALGTQVCAMEIDGPAGGTPVGSVNLVGPHSESNFNFAGTMSDICIGRTNQFGSVSIDGGNSWGSGDATHFPQYFLRVYSARNVSVTNYTASKLSSAGYAGGMFRIEAGTPVGSYNFSGNIADTTGAMYSDANSRCTVTGACVWDVWQINSLRLGNALGVNYGGTGLTSYTIGDLIVASGAAALSKISDVATGNVLCSGGLGAAPSYCKVSLTAAVTGVLPVANGGTNCSVASGNCLDNITGFASNGMIGRTGAGTYAARTLTGTANEITVTNGDGIAGNPAFSLPAALTFTGKTVTAGTFNNITIGGTTLLPVANGGTNCSLASGNCLDNITGFASNGMIGRTGAGTYAARTLTGTANEITVTNGDGIAGNPAFSLPAALTFTGKTVTAGTFNNITIGGTTLLPVANGGTNCSVASGNCLDNITGFGTNGILSRTGAGAYSRRTITGTAGQTTVTNGDGVSGNPTIALDQTTAANSFTPTITCDGSNALTTSGVSGSWFPIVGKLIYFTVTATVTANPSGCVQRFDVTLPNSLTAATNATVSAGNSGTGAGLSGIILTAANTKVLVWTDGSSFPGLIQFTVSGIFISS